MFPRLLNIPDDSILLLGPRGTGKSTWIKQNFSGVPIYDLLSTKEVIRLSKEPSILFNEVGHLKKGSWVIIDEVQKVPELLNEVHRLIEDRGLRFVLSGSSARKLKRGSTNLLAGRARLAHLFPLVSHEVDFKINIPEVFTLGTLPMAFTSDDPANYLRTYTEVYLEQEIRGEALTKNIGSFSRFLEIAARQNGQITNVSNISRDAHVARQTVQNYFDILCDTLIGSWLLPWKLKRATKQVAHPKFYFFDTGVVRSLSGRLPYPPNADELGPLFETFIINEVKAYLSYSGLNYPVYFWSSHDHVEVDLFMETRSGYIAIELKSTKRWDRGYNKGLNRISTEIGKKKVDRLGVYLGEREARFDKIRVLPLLIFLKMLWSGDIIG